jgi:hypothetical protein
MLEHYQVFCKCLETFTFLCKFFMFSFRLLLISKYTKLLYLRCWQSEIQISQRWCWWCRSSCLWHGVTRRMVSEVSNENSTCIFKCQAIEEEVICFSATFDSTQPKTLCHITEDQNPHHGSAYRMWWDMQQVSISVPKQLSQERWCWPTCLWCYRPQYCSQKSQRTHSQI